MTGWDKEITPNAIEVYVSRLRGKLEPHGIALRSIRGFGYRLELVESEEPEVMVLMEILLEHLKLFVLVVVEIGRAHV